MKKEDTNLKEGKEGGTVRREEKERRNVKIIKSQKKSISLWSYSCPSTLVPFRETPSYAKRRRLAGPSGLASPRPLQRSASDINLKGDAQPAASPGPTLRSLPHQLLLQRLQEEKDRDRDGEPEKDVGGPSAGRASHNKIR